MNIYNAIVFTVLVAGNTAVPQNENDTNSGYELDVARLRRLLFRESGYDATSRPTVNTSKPTIVQIAFLFKDIMHVKHEKDWFTIAMSICAFWHDHRLTWNKEEYDNRTFIHVHKKEVWSPDVDIVNAKTSDFDSVKCLLTVQPDGTVWSCSSSKFTLPCPIDTREFPTDKQVCTAHLTSTTYGDTEVKLVKGTVWGRYQEDASTEWNITGISYANLTAFNRSFLDVSFHFRRLSKRHRFAVTVPLVAATLVMLAAFWVPPGCDCRLTLAGQSLLSLAIVMDRTTPILRSFVATSYILIFLGIATVAPVVAAVSSVLVMNLLSLNTDVKFPDVLQRARPGRTAAFLLCVHEPQSGAHAEHRLHLPSFHETDDRRRCWLLWAQALDRTLFLVYVFIALGLLT